MNALASRIQKHIYKWTDRKDAEPEISGRDSVEFLETRGREPIPLENGTSVDSSLAGKTGPLWFLV